MRDLEELGFSRQGAVGPLKVSWRGEEIGLPADYVSFLGYQAPTDFAFVFTFLSAADQHEWEGLATEFMQYDEASVQDAVVSPPWDASCCLLPISVDPGGNYVYLELLPHMGRVVDVAYQTGTLSVVAESFGAFVDMLRPVE